MKVIKLVTLLILFSVATFAQDRFRFDVAYGDSRVPLLEKDTDKEVVRSVSAGADVQIFKLSKVRGSAGYLFEKSFNREVYPFYFDGMQIVDLYRNVNAHYAGAQLGLDIGHAVEPFIGYFVAPRVRVHEDAEAQVGTKLRIGANVTFTKSSKIFAKVAVDSNRAYGSPNKPPMPLPALLDGGFVNPKSRSVVVGLGLRF